MSLILFPLFAGIFFDMVSSQTQVIRGRGLITDTAKVLEAGWDQFKKNLNPEDDKKKSPDCVSFNIYIENFAKFSMY